MTERMPFSPDCYAPDFDRVGPYGTTVDDEDPLGRYDHQDDQEDFPDDDPSEATEDGLIDYDEEDEGGED